jgi:REP element-mobilizing transposase RayT
MPNYRRNRVPGATYFFTVNLREHRSGLLVTQIGALREAVREVRRQSPFRIDAWVVLPEHMHCLWTLPEGDSDFPDRWRRIKAAFSKSLPDAEAGSPVRLNNGERGIGSASTGSTRSATTATTRLTWITYTSIQSSTASPKIRALGRSPAFAIA